MSNIPAIQELLEETMLDLAEVENALSGLIRLAASSDDDIAAEFRALLLPHVGTVGASLANISTARSMLSRDPQSLDIGK